MYKPYIFTAIISLTTVLWLVSCGPTPETAKEYKNKISSIHKPVVQIGDSLEEAFDSYDTTRIKYTMHRANVVSKNAISELKQVRPITRDSILYKATGRYFQTFREVLGSEYRDKLDLYCIPDEQFTLENEKEIERLNVNKKEKLRTAAHNLKEAEDEFAQRYNLKIIEY